MQIGLLSLILNVNSNNVDDYTQPQLKTATIRTFYTIQKEVRSTQKTANYLKKCGTLKPR